MSNLNKFLAALTSGDTTGLPEPDTGIEKALAKALGVYDGPLDPIRGDADILLHLLAEQGLGGGGAGGVTLPELVNAALSAEILVNKEVIDQNGEKLTGTMPDNGAINETLDTEKTSVDVPAGFHNGSGKVSVVLEEKTVTPSDTAQEITPTAGKVLGKVTVEAAAGGGGGDGGVVAVAAKDVNFYDFDGTCVYAYTLAEFATLTELPAGPEHDGLTFSGWNATLDEIKAFGGPVGIGALYTTDDSKTHLHIRLARACSFSIASDNAGTVDWGDGSNTESLVRNDKVTHEYAAPGDYVIRLKGNSGDFTIAAAQCDYVGSEPTIFGGIAWQAAAIMEAHIAKTHRLSRGGLNYLPGLSAVSLGASVNLSSQCFIGCSSLKWVSLPRATQISTNTFWDCESLVEVTIPASVTSIRESAFSGCSGIQVFNLLSPTPPTLAGDDYLGTEYVTIYRVPAGCAETYMADTNWANYADYIVEGSL